MILQHLKKARTPEKILVFGQNLCASEHLERWVAEAVPGTGRKKSSATPPRQRVRWIVFKSSEEHHTLLGGYGIHESRSQLADG
jgi:prophage antirepressor-like protein